MLFAVWLSTSRRKKCQCSCKTHVATHSHMCSCVSIHGARFDVHAATVAPVLVHSSASTERCTHMPQPMQIVYICVRVCAFVLASWGSVLCHNPHPHYLHLLSHTAQGRSAGPSLWTAWPAGYSQRKRPCPLAVDPLIHLRTSQVMKADPHLQAVRGGAARRVTPLGASAVYAPNIEGLRSGTICTISSLPGQCQYYII